MKIFRGFIALMCLMPAAAFGFGLDETPPPEIHVKCQVGLSDIDVSSFRDVLTYHIKGTCKLEVPFAKGVWFPVGPYDVVASWRESDGVFNETIKGPQSIGDYQTGPQHGPWQMELGGTCKKDPFMTGADASSCSGRVTSSSNALFKFSESKFPASPRFVPASVRAGLTGKTIAAIEAEHQAPKILKPEEGKTYTDGVPISIDAGKGSPTKTFRLEWQHKSGAPGNPSGGSWDLTTVRDESGPSGTVPQAAFGAYWPAWRVRARASQSSKAAWSEWREFSVPVATPTKTPCAPTAQYGATYGAAATPSAMTINQTTTVPIKVTNTGSKTWTVAGSFHLAYHWAQNNVVVVAEGQRTNLPHDVAPCESVTVNAAVTAPGAAGSYTLQWDMVQENVTWFSTQGVPTGNRNVTISASAAPPPPPAKK